jgi:hypothetical protein
MWIGPDLSTPRRFRSPRHRQQAEETGQRQGPKAVNAPLHAAHRGLLDRYRAAAVSQRAMHARVHRADDRQQRGEDEASLPLPVRAIFRNRTVLTFSGLPPIDSPCATLPHFSRCSRSRSLQHSAAAQATDTATPLCAQDATHALAISRGRIVRSAASKREFERSHPCPSTGKATGACSGYVIDHVKPLKRGGADAPSNMQWKTMSEAKAKDRVE